MACPGPMDPETGLKNGADFCIPMKTGECYNMCPMQCGPNDITCAGGVMPDGCPMPGVCAPMDGKYFTV